MSGKTVTRKFSSQATKLTLLLLAGTCVLLWWPTRFIPYHWDGAMFVNRASHLLIKRNYQPLVLEYTEFAHPPLFVIYHSLFVRNFGEMPLSGHLAMLPLLIAYIWLTFFIANRVFNNRFTSFIAALLVTFTPFVMAEFGQMYLDLAVAVMVMGALLAQIKGWTRTATFCLLIGVLTKLTALAILPLLLWLLWKKSQGDRNFFIVQALWYQIPLLAAIFWLLYHFHYTNWWLTVPGRISSSPRSITEGVEVIGKVGHALFIDQFRWLLTLPAVIAIARTKFKQLNSTIWVYVAAIGLFLGLYVVMGELLYRYLLPIYPLFIVVSVYFIQRFIANKKMMVIGALLLLMLFMSAWHPKNSGKQEYLVKPPEDLRYKDFVTLGTQVAQFVEKNHPEAQVYGGHTELYIFAEPYQGYLTIPPVSTTYCHLFNRDQTSNALIILHPYSQHSCQSLVNALRPQVIKRFEVNDLWANVYLVTVK